MSASLASVGAMSVAPLVDYLSERGDDPRRLHALLGVPREAPLEPTLRLPVAKVFALWEHAAREDPRGSVSARVAAGATLESAHLLGMLALTAPTVRAGLEAIVRHGALHTDSGTWHVFEDARGVAFRFRRAGAPTLGHRVCNEAALCHFVNGIRRASGVAFSPSRAWVRHEPLGMRELRDFFGCPVEHGAEDEGFVVERALLDAVPPGNNPVTFSVLCHAAEREVRRLVARSLADRVRSEVSYELDKGDRGNVDATVISRRLGLSERSLRRKLELEGTSFRTLLEAVRGERARVLLEDPSRSITDIAFSLGYSEVSAFSHAYRRWFGIAPRARRKVRS